MSESRIARSDIERRLAKLKVGAIPPQPAPPPDQRTITQSWSGGQDPLVSIVCHTFNHEATIGIALNGFLNQVTDFPYEIIVHDDASSDATPQIIEHYATRYPDIVVPIYQKENQYQKGARPLKFTFPAARGEFVALCEGDDYWLDPFKVQTQASFLLCNREYAICGHDALIVEGGVVKCLSKLPSRQKRDASAAKLKSGVSILTLTAMFRKEIDPYPYEHQFIVNGDMFLFSRMGEIGKYKYIDSILPGVYTRHAGGVWSQLDEKRRAITHINSNVWVAQYHQRKGDRATSLQYAHKSALKVYEVAPILTLGQLVRLNWRLLKQIGRRRWPALGRLRRLVEKRRV